MVVEPFFVRAPSDTSFFATFPLTDYTFDRIRPRFPRIILAFREEEEEEEEEEEGEEEEESWWTETARFPSSSESSGNKRSRGRIVVPTVFTLS